MGKVKGSNLSPIGALAKKMNPYQLKEVIGHKMIIIKGKAFY
jgi:replication-associated recombination protein RarA